MKDKDRKEIVNKMAKSFEDTLKYALDKCIERDKEWSEINQDRAKKEKHGNIQLS